MSIDDLLAATVHSAVFNPPQLIREVVYQPASDDSNPPDAFCIQGVWSGPHKAINLSAEGPEYSTTEPSLDVRLSDFETPPKQSDTLTSLGISYQVIDVQPDGLGLATLVLQLN